MANNFCLRNHQAAKLAQSLWGLSFTNPLGLAAGFDKDGTAARAWPLMGFGFAELGTVTYHAQPGNPKPRMFRLVSDNAALNRMGFNNGGAAALSTRLDMHWPERTYPIPIGINLGKSKVTALEDAAEDYRKSLELLKDQGSYFVVNLSRPRHRRHLRHCATCTRLQFGGHHRHKHYYQQRRTAHTNHHRNGQSRKR